MGEIATSSEEQAKGIEQINEALAQMEDVTQNNAANAEESAAASSEMNQQAEILQEHVTTLTAIVVSAALKVTNRSNSHDSHDDRHENSHVAQGSSSRGSSSKQLVAAPKHGPKKPAKDKYEQAMPLDDDDFGDFKA